MQDRQRNHLSEQQIHKNDMLLVLAWAGLYLPLPCVLAQCIIHHSRTNGFLTPIPATESGEDSTSPARARNVHRRPR
jgi:dolichyl-phosphate-mannose--protein O-mannosyl transferase